MRATSADGVVVLLDHEAGPGTAAVTVAAPDRTGLMATVAGVLSLHRLQVRGAQIDTVTAPDGARRAVQVWTVTPAYGDPPPEDRLREDITRALAGTLDVAARLDAREQAYPAPSGHRGAARRRSCPGPASARPCSRCAPTTPPRCCTGSSRAIAAADVTIIAARVATLGSEVVDVFYLVGPRRRAAHRGPRGHGVRDRPRGPLGALTRSAPVTLGSAGPGPAGALGRP